MNQRETILKEILLERERQINLAHGGDTEAFDRTNTQNDWVAYICTYAGRAAAKVFRNIKEGHSFRVCILKVAALCLAAIEAYDKGYCKDE